VHVRHPAYRLVVKADAPFPSDTREDDWRLTSSRDASDVNAVVHRGGHSLFRIELSLSEIPK
jgi:hypothetical protein